MDPPETQSRFERDDVWGHVQHSPDIQQKVRLFRSLVPDDVTTIVDVGCGDGAITNELARDWDVTGVDASAAALEHVTTKSVTALAQSLPFGDRAFDLVVSSQMLEHLSDADYAVALAELKRVAGRYALISVPYREDLGMRVVRCPRCGWRGHVWGHRQYFTTERLLRDLAGFQVISIHILGDLQDPPWPRPLVWLFHHVLNGHYVPTGQTPVCERCDNDDFSGVRGFPPHSQRLKDAIDRVRRRPRVPYWIAVLARRVD